MGKGSNTTTQQASGSTTTAPNAGAMDAYQRIMAKASQAADTPYQGFSGEEVAPNNAQQNAGIGTINQATRRIGAAGAPLSADDINRYMNPYTNDVVNATQADFDVQNQRANSAVTGNAAAQGALGGDRVGVAQALTQESQNRAQAPIIAGLRSSAYNSGLGAAEHEQQYGLNSAQALMGAGQSQVGAGTLEQQTQQAKDTQGRADYYQQQGYPFQVAQWMAGIDTGVGSQMGGTSTNSTQGQTQGPTPNTFAQIAGAGLGAFAAFAKARGGRVAGFAGGGLAAPFANDAQSWVPQMGLTAGHGAPSPPQVHAPEAPKEQGLSMDQIMKGGAGLGKAFSNSSYGDAMSDYMQDTADGDAGSFGSYFGGGSWRGGRVRGYASGGTPGGGLPWLDDASAGWYAPDLIPTVAGFGASTPAVQSRSEEPADIPGEFRLDDQAHRDWQGRVDRDTGRARTNAAVQQGEPPPDLKPRPVGEVMLAQNDNGSTDPGLGPRGNPRPISAQEDMANAIHDGTVPAGGGSALGYGEEPRRGLSAPRPPPAPPPPDQQPKDSGGGFLSGLGIHLTPELRQGLLQAGLAMMATKRGGPGSFLGAAGEGGLRGVAGYNASVQAQQEADQQQFKNQMAVDELEMKHQTQDADLRQKPIGPNGELTSGWKAKQDYESQMTDYQKSEERRHQIDQAIRLKTPIKIDETVSGQPVMALPRIDAKGNVALYPIDRQGNVSETPIEPGGKTKPSAAAVSNAAETWQPDPKAAPGAPGSRNEAFLQQIRQDDPGHATAIQKAANYELDPAKYASMKSDKRQRFIDQVLKYDPSFSPQDMGLKYQARKAFLPGTKNGDTITAFNTAISHLDVLKELFGALKNGDNQMISKIRNSWHQYGMGEAAPNDVSALNSIIGTEVAKATAGPQNAFGDREEVRKSISRDLSKMQSDSVIDKYQKLMGGQLNARKFAYEKSTGLHNFEDQFLEPRSQVVVRSLASGPPPEAIVGEVREGWKFKGGNWRDKANWERVGE